MATSTENDASDGTSSIAHVPLLRMQPSPTHDVTSTSSSSTLIQRYEFEELYSTYQALHIRGFVPRSQKKCDTTNRFQASDVQSLFELLNNHDKSTWCIENKANHSGCSGDQKLQITPSEFLDVNNTNHRGYCSFLVQESKDSLNDLLSGRLPVLHLPVANSDTSGGDMMKVDYGPCLWLFFGKNSTSDDENASSSETPTTLQGRPEHTDSITHDGTWHYQLSGTKLWRLRPTTELMQRIKKCREQKKIQDHTLSGSKRKFDSEDGKHGDKEIEANTNCDDTNKHCIEVECKEGDILLVNTRLWWHSTLIPVQHDPCISYARDIYLPGSDVSAALLAENVSLEKHDDDQGAEKSGEKQQQQQSSMTNVDGTYAAEDVEADTILFTEHTMPDCELHRSKTNPNCQVVELEDDETGESYMAVVSMRDIKAGEFFSILESDDEEGDASDDGCADGWEEEQEEE